MISVVVPAYNQQHYIEECINSILNQQLVDLELIIVDDGSTDATGQICDKYAARHNVKVLHVKNGGLSYARNIGIDAASGHWITFVDADDALLPKALWTLKKAQEKYSDDIVVGSYIMAKSMPSDQQCNLNRPFQQESLNSLEAISKVLYQGKLLYNNSACGNLYRKSIFDKERFTEGLYYEDLDIFYRLFLQCERVSFLDAPVMFYRQHSSSIINSWSNKRPDIIKVADTIYHFMDKNYPTLVPAARSRCLNANFNVYIDATAAGEREIADNCWADICQLRHSVYLDSNIRFKTKVGILMSYLPRGIFNLFCQCFKK